MNCKRESLCRVLEPIHWSHSGESTWCLAAEDLKGGCRSYLGKKNICLLWLSGHVVQAWL